MNHEILDTMKSLVECVKLQQQLMGQLFEFCDGQKADRNPADPNRRDAMVMRGNSTRSKMQTTSTAINTKIAELEKNIESMTK